MKKSREELLLREKEIYGLPLIISDEERKLLDANVPIQKIIGYVNFDDVQINLNHDVLIPRYETEEVVHKALKFIKADSKVLDLCCGSGYIGLTLKKKTNADVTLSDISDEAIEQSIENAKFNNLNVKVIKSDLFEDINGKFDVIVSNPPYIPLTNKLDSSVLDNEPHNALFAEENGNYFYRKIIEEADKHLNPKGFLIFEISDDNVDFLMKNNFQIFNDINGKKRIAIKQF